MKLLRHLLMLHSPYTNFCGCSSVEFFSLSSPWLLSSYWISARFHKKVIYEPDYFSLQISQLPDSFIFLTLKINFLCPLMLHCMMTYKNHYSHFEKQIKPECESRREKLNSLEGSIVLFHLSNYNCDPLLSWDWTGIDAVSQSQVQDESSREKTQPLFWKKIPVALHPTTTDVKT